MKKIMPVFILTLVLLNTALVAQNQFEVMTENTGEKIFKGIISREVIETEPSFTWYKSNLAGYKPNNTAVEALKKNADSLQLLVFMGTWCSDSHYIIPKFYSLLDAAGFSAANVTLIGTDRNKKTLSHLAEALGIINVPTIIVLKNGKELGRVVEYGKSGQFDKDLGEIVVGLK